MVLGFLIPFSRRFYRESVGGSLGRSVGRLDLRPFWECVCLSFSHGGRNGRKERSIFDQGLVC